jgi:hypothetical protein
LQELERYSLDELLRGNSVKRGQASDEQPRVPAGHPDGGQWTSGGGIDDPRVLSDAKRDNDWISGGDYAAVGHHDTPQSLVKKLRLRPETLLEFQKAVSGPLGLRTVDPVTRKVLVQHRWDKAHREYNEAVGELLKMYLDGLRSRGITEERMMPEHAKAFRTLIHQSQDPRISNFLKGIELLRNLRRLRRFE